MNKYEFDAEILQSDEIGAGSYVLIPFDVKECFGKKNHIKVECTFDGASYRGSIVNMGEGPCIGILKSIREKIGKSKGDTVHIVLWEDRATRVVVMPPDLAEAIKGNTKAKEGWVSLSYSNKKMCSDFVTSAKKEETRSARVKTASEKLSAGIKKLK